MNKISSLIIHNLKKAKGQYVSFGIIVIITALIINIALVLAFQTFKAYDRSFEDKNTADINLIIPEFFDYDGLKNDLCGIDGVTFAEKHSGIFLSLTVNDFADSDFDMNTVFYDLDSGRSVNLIEVSGYSDKGENTVYIPEYISKLGGFEDKDNIVYTIDGSDHSYKIGGTVSEMQYGNYGTGLIGGYMPKAAYDKLAEEYESSKVAEYSVKTKSGADLAAIKNSITSLADDKNLMILSLGDRETAKQTRTMVCSLLIAIFLALAVIIFAVSIFLSNFRIRSTIEDEMTDMGVLKALGYTSSMIMTASVIPYVLVGAAGTIIGTAVSYAAVPSIAEILAVQSGFSFTPVFDIAAALITVAVPVIVIFFFARIAAGKIRALEPINAIRGITGSTAAKNHFPLETSKTGVGFTLILKQIASSLGQNILLFAVSFGIMVLLSFAGTLLYNVNIKPDNFMDTISEETPSVIYTAADGKKSELKKALKDISAAEKVIEYGSSPVSYEDGSLTAFVCEDFALVTNDICYEGRNPSSDSEAAIGSALAEKYEIGGKIELKSGEKTSEYTVTGYIQSVNNSGAVCELTNGGYEKISGSEPASISVYLNGVSAEDFIEAHKDELSDLVLSEQNYEQLAANGRKLYAGIISAVTAVLFIISVLIVLLVMYIIINSMISRRRQEFGIYKAVGYSSTQLTVQTALSFVPVVAVSSLLSAVLGLWYMPAVDNGIFSMIGAMKNHFTVPLGVLIAFAAVLTLVSFVISVLLASPIKKITTYSLLKE